MQPASMGASVRPSAQKARRIANAMVVAVLAPTARPTGFTLLEGVEIPVNSLDVAQSNKPARHSSGGAERH